MTEKIIIFLSYLFDMLLLIFFLKINFKNRQKKVPVVLFYLGFLVVEIILSSDNVFLMGNYTRARAIWNIMSGIITTFCLTYYFNVPLHNRFYAAISFQAICGVSEMACACIVIPLLQNIYHMDERYMEPYITVSSKIILFLLILLIDIIWNRRKKHRNISYDLLILLTPTLSLIIIFNIPTYFLFDDSLAYMCATVFGCLAILNIVNYYLLENVLQVADLKEREKQLDQQLAFQTAKYQQISSAYRSTRSLLHDTKKHFLYIQNCILEERYGQLTDYLTDSLKHLEHSYSQINTGNLVIDAFISNYMTIAKQEAIGFITDIQVVAERIPTEDYDLCVILGNLLDNSLNAARLIPVPQPRQIEVEIFTSELEFVIHVKNTCVKTKIDRDSKMYPEELYHGFGITNIQKLVEKYYGIHSCFPEEQSFETIIVIPINK